MIRISASARTLAILGATIALLLGACSSSNPVPSAASATGEDAAAPSDGGPATPSADQGTVATIAAVGDMVCSAHPGGGANPASDDTRFLRGFCQYKKVSDVVAQGEFDRFLPLGDLQYYFGRLSAYKEWYGPTYGRSMQITEPVPGNHDSYTQDAAGNPYAGYRAYFGKRAHWNRHGGSYSYNLNGWHIIALNSEWCHSFAWAAPGGHWTHVPSWSKGTPWGCHEGDPQYDWLVRDLEANVDAMCTLAYFHHPAYFWVGYAGGPDSLVHDGYTSSRPLYRALYRHGADVVLTGHEHFYERMAPIDPTGELDDQYGFTQFIVGTGGDTLEPMPPESAMIPQVAAASNTAFGVLQLNLGTDSYSWEFVPAKGSPGHWRTSEKLDTKIFVNGNDSGATVDGGTANCHGVPPPAPAA